VAFDQHFDRPAGHPQRPWRSGKHRGFTWDAQPLGKKPDREIARELGCSHTAVGKARTARRIPALTISDYALTIAADGSCTCVPDFPDHSLDLTLFVDEYLEFELLEMTPPGSPTLAQRRLRDPSYGRKRVHIRPGPDGRRAFRVLLEEHVETGEPLPVIVLGPEEDDRDRASRPRWEFPIDRDERLRKQSAAAYCTPGIGARYDSDTGALTPRGRGRRPWPALDDVVAAAHYDWPTLQVDELSRRVVDLIAIRLHVLFADRIHREHVNFHEWKRTMEGRNPHWFPLEEKRERLSMLVKDNDFAVRVRGRAKLITKTTD
jgi:hypothetical protein